MQIFDRQILRKNRDKVASTIARNDFIIQELFIEAAARIALRRNQFDTVLNLGSRVFDFGLLSKDVLSINTLINSDLSKKMLEKVSGYNVQIDEENLPFRDASFDLVVSILNLHYINDLPGTLIQINRSLKKGGIFFASFIGENSLREMRESFIQAELKHYHGASMRVPPMIQAKTFSDLMRRASFSDVIVDKEEIKFSYGHPKQIFSDIKNLGESDCLIKRVDIGNNILNSYYKYYSDNFSVDKEVVCSCDIISVLGTKSGG